MVATAATFFISNALQLMKLEIIRAATQGLIYRVRLLVLECYENRRIPRY